MVRTSNALALLRVLAVAAWADSTVSQSELNYIKDLARRFSLSDDDWFALQPYLEDPPHRDEIDSILRDLMGRLGSDQERRVVIDHLEGIVSSDHDVTEEESRLLERYKEILGEASSLELMFGRLKSLFSGASAPQPTVDLDEFLRNKILFKLRRRSDEPLTTTPEIHRIALLGGLMGIVAHADGDIHERELAEIRRQLDKRGNFEDFDLDLLTAIIQEEAVRGLDRYRLLTEYTRGATIDDRIELLDLLFTVAAADDGLTHAELEELRSMSSGLNLSHRQYIAAKVRVKG
jgi:uncharacterized tellurite resistance protein B-like protein